MLKKSCTHLMDEDVLRTIVWGDEPPPFSNIEPFALSSLFKHSFIAAISSPCGNQQTPLNIPEYRFSNKRTKQCRIPGKCCRTLKPTLAIALFTGLWHSGPISGSKPCKIFVSFARFFYTIFSKCRPS